MNPKYDTIFLDDLRKEKDMIKQMSDDEVKAFVDKLELQFPIKMSTISKLQKERSILVEFITKIIFDEVYGAFKIEEQLKSSSLNFTNPFLGIPKKSDIDAAKQTLDGYKKKDLQDIYFQATNTTLNSNVKKQEIKEKILQFRFGVDIMKDYDAGLIGNGLKRRKIVGRGYESPIEVRQKKNATMKKVINGKYIDLTKLKNNIITIRYCSTGALIPTVKVQSISKDVKEIVEDIMDNRFEKRLFEKLDINEKRLIKRIVAALNVDVDVRDNSDDEFAKQFQVILGQFRAGNNNVAIKRKLREYIAEATEAGMMPRRESQKLIFELANSD
jgi:hypothetical protein